MELRKLNASLPFVEIRGADLRAWLTHPEEGRAELRTLLAAHGLAATPDDHLQTRTAREIARAKRYFSSSYNLTQWQCD